MNYNNILISILFFFTISTILTNGILMIHEKDKLEFNQLKSLEKGYVFSLVYTEIYLALLVVYNLIYYLYYCIFSCYSEGELTFNYNCYKALFLFSGIATQLFLFYILCFHPNMIDENVNNINIIFNTNFIITIITTIIFKCFKINNNTNNKNVKYEDLN